MKITENFTYEELIESSIALKKKIDNTPTEEEKENLIRLTKEILQPIRTKYGKPITITSGFRCEKLNKAVGGVSTSQHRKGEAVDIIGENNKELWDVIVSMVKSGEITVGQLINEKKLSWIHISLPTKKHKNKIFSL